MPAGTENLLDLLATTLPVPLRHIPDRIRDVARGLELSAALAGGIPRDVLRVALGQLHRDLFMTQARDFDVVVAGRGDPRLGGAAIPFAYELARRLPGKLTINAAFHTATLVTDDPVRIDLTTARTETYPRPGQLPEVDVSGVDIATDLLRRDFAANAIALDIADDYGQLIDPAGGLGDIAARQIRVLHGASFSDDPTRLLRAVRYSVRLGYDLEPVTRAQFSQAVDDGVLDHVSPERIRNELEWIGGEERWAQMWAVLDIAGVLGELHPALTGLSAGWDEADYTALDIAISNQHELLGREGVEPWLLRTAWALQDAPLALLPATAHRLGLFPRQVDWLTAAHEVVAYDVPRIQLDPRPSIVCRLLERRPRQGVLLALFTFQPAAQVEVALRKELLRYLEEYSHVRCALTGGDLRRLGLQPGPLLGRLRDELRFRRLDGDITERTDEEAAARELLAQWLKPGNGELFGSQAAEDTAPDTADEEQI